MTRPARKDTGETVRALLGDVPPPPPRAPRPTPAGAESVSRAPAKRSSPPPAAAAERAALGPMMQARIPAALFERVRAAKDADGATHEMWFLDAFDAVYDLLAEVYRPGPARKSRVPVRQRRTRRPTGDPLVSYPLRLTAEEWAVLEERRAELSPPSLADFVTTIVRLRLDQLERGE